jgi:hypothetical protein
LNLLMNTTKQTSVLHNFKLPLALALAIFTAACASPTVIDVDAGRTAFVSSGIGAINVRLSGAALSNLGGFEAQAAQLRLEGAAQSGLAGRNGFVAAAGQRLELVITELKLRNLGSGLLLGGEQVRGQGRVYDSRERLLHTFAVETGGANSNAASAVERFAEIVASGVFGASGRLAAVPAPAVALQSTAALPVLEAKPEPEPALALPVAAPRPLAAVALLAPLEAPPRVPVAVQASVSQAQVVQPVGVPVATSAPERGLALITQRLTADAIVGLPAVTPEVIDEFRSWLDRRMPRAFALSGDGQGFGTHVFEQLSAGEPQDPSARALTNCRNVSKSPCRLLAVDDRLVLTRASATSSKP